MFSWKSQIEAYYNWAHSGSGYNLIINKAASLAEIEKVEELINFKFPSELRDLYLFANGIEMEGGKNSFYIFEPLTAFSDLVEVGRDWMYETHPNISSRFYAIFDWQCGDYTGYLTNEKGEILEGLYTFEHEMYGFEEDQSWKDFLVPSHKCLSDFLQQKE